MAHGSCIQHLVYHYIDIGTNVNAAAGVRSVGEHSGKGSRGVGRAGCVPGEHPTVGCVEGGGVGNKAEEKIKDQK